MNPTTTPPHDNGVTVMEKEKLSDFRNAIFENHWNDPPKKIFHKNKDEELHDLDLVQWQARLQALLENCQATFTTGPNKRILLDTNKRLQPLLETSQAEQFDKPVLVSVGQLCQALHEQEWDKASDIHQKLMTSEYERHGNWLLGMKRLIDLSQKAAA
ncbi:hypothetical protein DM01DRAFT_1407956 [Hesseltinella vesiculosa]|uniref:SRA1/Sec31 domain-containing protein n=1 Tax=Hesseltinella vesiculosa TaxID=101127 RepID=A0A1X2GGH8_9FUNG|nr:hypothetical protein DM01DRAFT_1407956 [Hesseltinella vesiculosa]